MTTTPTPDTSIVVLHPDGETFAVLFSQSGQEVFTSEEAESLAARWRDLYDDSQYVVLPEALARRVVEVLV